MPSNNGYKSDGICNDESQVYNQPRLASSVWIFDANERIAVVITQRLDLFWDDTVEIALGEAEFGCGRHQGSTVSREG